ncbi:MAG: hypothetical protein M1826_003053 [Phylliscum demangeonii]|nr:MAG: hypothetical protein M1826_003053 [Phylliscum demangeonii]
MLVALPNQGAPASIQRGAGSRTGRQLTLAPASHPSPPSNIELRPRPPTPAAPFPPGAAHASNGTTIPNTHHPPPLLQRQQQQQQQRAYVATGGGGSAQPAANEPENRNERHAVPSARAGRIEAGHGRGFSGGRRLWAALLLALIRRVTAVMDAVVFAAGSSGWVR